MKAGCYVFAAALALAGCQLEEVGAGAGLELPYFELVYECDCERDSQTFRVDVCWDDTADQLELAILANEPRVVEAQCWVTSSGLGPCSYCCGPDCSNGSYCPAVRP